MIKHLKFSILIAVIATLAACTAPSQNNGFPVRVIHDGKESVFNPTEHVSVSQFLQQVNITLGELDHVDPPDFTPITENMQITIVRVRDQTVCRDEQVSYQTQFLNNPDLAPGTTKIMQPGANGAQHICDEVIYEDGVERSRTPGNPTITTPPTTEIVARGVDRKSQIEPQAVTGLLAYIADGSARVIENNTLSDRALPTGGGLDARVFAFSPDGHQLLFTRRPEGTPTRETYNQLWVLLDTTDPNATPVRLTALDNILTADWVPGQPFTFSYSTLQPRDQVPGYQALNDLNIARLDSRTGKLLKVTVVLKSRPTGVYGLWGTQFKWSPDGKSLAWGQADGVGIVDFKAGAFKKLFDFRVYSTTLSRSWVWTPYLTWSPNSDLLAATIHGKPLHNEPDETSPVFDIELAQANDKAAGLYEVNLVPQAGIWAAPSFSPLADDGTGDNPHLKRTKPDYSISSEYDLVVEDRDGSNARVVFPDKDKPGIKPIETLFGNEIAWSPDARQAALIYHGNRCIIDVQSGH